MHTPSGWRNASIGRKALRLERPRPPGLCLFAILTYHGRQHIDRDALRSNGVTREPGHGWKPGDDYERGTTRERPVNRPGSAR